MVKVWICKTETPPKSAITSKKARIAPAIIAGLTNGNMTLNIVFTFELPNDFDAKKILKEILLNLDFVNR